MIHSLSGGVLKDKKFKDLAKVKILEGLDKDLTFWYEMPFLTKIKENDIVLVPFGQSNKLIKAIVIQIKKDVREDLSPVPFTRIKKISEKV